MELLIAGVIFFVGLWAGFKLCQFDLRHHLPIEFQPVEALLSLRLAYYAFALCRQAEGELVVRNPDELLATYREEFMRIEQMRKADHKISAEAAANIMSNFASLDELDPWKRSKEEGRRGPSDSGLLFAYRNLLQLQWAIQRRLPIGADDARWRIGKHLPSWNGFESLRERCGHPWRS